MLAKKGVNLPSDLAGAERQFTKWRRTRKLGTRIPEPLWASAVKLASTHGLHPTASTLRLDYYSLKQRLKRAAAAPRPPQSGPSFVELSAPCASGLHEWSIDFENPAGARMRVQVKGGDALDVLALGRSFWGLE
jgi:pyruvate/2-oxoacid:ferredoxin oxidoreductase beta subunit